jgi:hypothetical protein
VPWGLILDQPGDKYADSSRRLRPGQFSDRLSRRNATVAGRSAGEQLVFLHYVGTGTGPAGPFAIRGLDRVRTRDGIVVENVIRYDQVELEAS